MVTKMATPKQIAYLSKLLLSSAIPSEEALTVTRWLNSGYVTSIRISEGIDWAKSLIDKRNAERKASEERKQAYHAAKKAS